MDWGVGAFSLGLSISIMVSWAAFSPISKAGISMEVMLVSSISPMAWPVMLMTLTCPGST